MAYTIHIITGLFLGVSVAGWAPIPALTVLGAASLTITMLVFIPRSGFDPPMGAFLPILVGVSVGQILGLGWRYPLETAGVVAAIALALFIFIGVRHVTLRRRRRVHPITSAADSRRRPEEKGHGHPPLYVLAVLGSGGHTKEMLLMMGNDFRESEQSHRRYLVTKGDELSLKQAEAFERSLKKIREHPGTYDIHMATRARRVHQSLFTTPVSALRSVLDIFPILLTRPRQVTPGSPFYLPDVVFTNGPATGFFVGLVAHMLKVFCIVPEYKMQVLFIESWARVSSLSLTGKLFYYTGIADMFLVQHESVANIYGVMNAGWLVLDPSLRHRHVS